MKNILVTGGAGFIGSNFIHFLLKTEPKVNIINLDAFTYAGTLENLKDLPDMDRHTLVKGNICDQDLLADLFQRYVIDTVVHFAAESHVDRSIAGPGPFIQTNIAGTYMLLEAARSYWAGAKNPSGVNVRFHHVSTDEVYGSLNPSDAAFTENTPYAPNSPYAATKASSDHLVRSYGHTYNLPFTITNCSNNFGPRQFPEKLIPLIILNALNGRKLPIYGDGLQVRDWLFVEDHCEAILTVLQNGQTGETYNIGGGNQPANLDIVHMICDLLDETCPDSPFVPHRDLIEFVTDRPGHDRRYAMNIEKIRNTLGWQPKHSLQEGLKKTVQWYLSNVEWIAAIRTQQEYQHWLAENYDKRESSI